MTAETPVLPFPVVAGKAEGYDIDQVDEFLAAARRAFETDDPTELSSVDVRRTAFRLVKRGYQIAAVDAAMGRIEDAFAARERENALAREGARAWVGSSRKLAQEVLDRLSRPARERFRRVGALRWGYRIDEVDAVADRIARYLESGESLTVEQVRTVAFRMQRGGYDEVQVDAVLDAVIEVMLAVG
ncbi:DivIVA domain-containing protein [Microbacterium sp. LjRoot45]|uniref:DivIVA domain-containing protein n=1 Tax=Microbacterium sp. LjRoot45 TaxID=3342329 RepID=UPI003ED01E38